MLRWTGEWSSTTPSCPRQTTPPLFGREYNCDRCEHLQHTHRNDSPRLLSANIRRNGVLKSRLQYDVAASFIASSITIAAKQWIRTEGRKDLSAILDEAFATTSHL
jgi:hypothetical protein